MKLRKCSLLQRPRLVSGLRHGLEMSIRFATVYRDTYGERNNRAPLPLFRIEIHLFDRFPRLERERTTRDFTVSVGKFAESWMLQQAEWQYLPIYRFASKRRRFLSQVTYMQVHDVFSSSSGFLRFFFFLSNFFVGLPDCFIVELCCSW